MGKELVKRPDEEHLKLDRVWVPWWGNTLVVFLAWMIAWSVVFGTVALPGWVTSVAFGALVVFVMLRVGNFRERQLETVEPPLQLLAMGELDAAADQFEQLAKAEKKPHARCGWVLSVGYVRMRQQRFDEARSILAEAERGSSVAAIRAMVRAEQAECLALAGDLSAADTLMRKTPGARPHAAASAAVVWTMLGKHKQVLTLSNKRIPKRLRRYAGHEVAVLALMKAFASKALERDFDEHHAAAQPSFEGEYDYLTDNWPELAQFVAEHPWDGLRSPDAALPRARIVER